MRIIIGIVLGCGLAACAPSTHVRQSAADLVVLQSASAYTGCGGTTAGLTFRRVFQDGNGALQPFQIPADRSLLITDVDRQYRHPSGAAAAGRPAVP
jgi:hypothetical protein